jgi:hypothetical protein
MSARRPANLYLWLLCIALLCARLGGAHLHLCLDDSELPVGVHASEPGHHDAHHNDPAHDDRDVSLIGEALKPLIKLFADLPPLLAALFFGLTAFALVRRPAGNGTQVPNPQNRLFRPPLRAPPSSSR